MHHEEDRLLDMLAFANEAIAIAGGRSRSDFENDRILTLALVKLVETVGEAAQGVSEVRQQQLAAIPWRQIIATRHRLVHGYRAFDLDVLWSILHDDLPALIEALHRELGV